MYKKASIIIGLLFFWGRAVEHALSFSGKFILSSIEGLHSSLNIYFAFIEA